MLGSEASGSCTASSASINHPRLGLDPRQGRRIILTELLALLRQWSNQLAMIREISAIILAKARGVHGGKRMHVGCWNTRARATECGCGGQIRDTVWDTVQIMRYGLSGAWASLRM